MNEEFEAGAGFSLEASQVGLGTFLAAFLVVWAAWNVWVSFKNMREEKKEDINIVALCSNIIFSICLAVIGIVFILF
ncbi:DUF3262 family protein [Hahella ganghwensis]|uniref:DUF3262 family protein n=1 Tax=Hahella ganghwensis TaxID=286420 RepID=UPI0003683656|nr:DUF3262 family protein [Hahella ganghwensis]